jgi:multimeric flavodoxin WrbA
MNNFKVFCISGSPSIKSESNYHSRYLKLRLERINDIEFISKNINNMDIRLCNGCLKCFTHGQCPLDKKDGFLECKEQILSSSVLVIITPVFSNSVSWYMKNIIDRIIHWSHYMNLAGKAIAIIDICGSNGIPTLNYLNSIALGLGLKVIANEMLQSSDIDANCIKLDNVYNKILIIKRNNCFKLYSSNELEDTFKILQKYFKDSSKRCFEYEKSIWIDNQLIDACCYKEFLQKISICRVHDK